MNTREDELGPAVRLEEPKTSRQCKECGAKGNLART